MCWIVFAIVTIAIVFPKIYIDGIIQFGVDTAPH